MLPDCVSVFFDMLPVEEPFESLFFHIDHGHNVFVLNLRGNREELPEDVEAKITADEPHQMVATCLRLCQGHPGGYLLLGEA